MTKDDASSWLWRYGKNALLEIRNAGHWGETRTLWPTRESALSVNGSPYFLLSMDFIHGAIP